MDDLDDVVQEFLIESHENLDQLERDLVYLEENPAEPDVLSRIFRTIHTIKGTCGFLGYGKLEALTHAGENLLSKLRDGEVPLTTDVATVLLEQVDAVREMLSAIEQHGNEGAGDYDHIVRRLELLMRDGLLPRSEAAADTARTGVESGEGGAPAADDAGDALEVQVAVAPGTPPPRRDDSVLEIAQELLVPSSTFDGTLDSLSEGPPRHSTLGGPGPSTSPTKRQSAARQRANAADQSVRVHVDLLDRLMNLVGELVLARNQILRIAEGSREAALVTTTQRLNQVTTELQEGVMTTRMQPIGNVWSKLPRVVRDLARACRKQVRLEMEGEDTGLDKTLIEAIKDPLTHLVRNAVDHGIESPHLRMSAGKEPEGVLTLRAFHEGGQVNIEIEDDGGGIDPQKLINKALERQLITPEQAGRLGERQALNLLFLPGFSTAEKVTNVSGRGVGMDVVKTNVERIGGTIDIATSLGEGTVFKVKIPLTLAIVPALIVRCARERYAIPQVNLLELVRLEGAECELETIHGSPVFHLRGRLLPILHLREQLLLPAPEIDPDTAADRVQHIVVLQADDQRFGLVVDEVHDTEEIVVKPLGRHVQATGAFAGATIMGDGQVALILDVVGLAHRGGVVGRVDEREIIDAAVEGLPELDETTSLLVVRSGGRACAIPLERVARLEEVELAAIEYLGSLEVVQYRGAILPLVHAASEADRPLGQDALQVVVFDHGGLLVGLVVDAIIDILSERVDVRRVGARPGVLGSTIVAGKVVEVLDVDAMARLTGVAMAVDLRAVEATG